MKRTKNKNKRFSKKNEKGISQKNNNRKTRMKKIKLKQEKKLEVYLKINKLYY